MMVLFHIFYYYWSKKILLYTNNFIIYTKRLVKLRSYCNISGWRQQLHVLQDVCPYGTYGLIGVHTLYNVAIVYTSTFCFLWELLHSIGITCHIDFPSDVTVVTWEFYIPLNKRLCYALIRIRTFLVNFLCFLHHICTIKKKPIYYLFISHSWASAWPILTSDLNLTCTSDQQKV